MKYVFLFLSTIGFASHTDAQFNSKVGYTGSYYTFGTINEIFDEYNAASTFDKELESLHILHGLQLGLRYRVSNFSMELGVTTGTATSEAVGIENGMRQDVRWKASAFDYHLGLTQHIDNIGIGATLTRTRISIKKYNTVSTEFADVTRSHNMGLNVFFQWEVPGAYTSFAIRPFYQFMFDSYDQAPVRDALAPTYGGDTNDSVRIFGLSILFFNGSQS